MHASLSRDFFEFDFHVFLRVRFGVKVYRIAGTSYASCYATAEGSCSRAGFEGERNRAQPTANRVEPTPVSAATRHRRRRHRHRELNLNSKEMKCKLNSEEHGICVDVCACVGVGNWFTLKGSTTAVAPGGEEEVAPVLR